MRALRRQPVERPPIWIMRQAGRYLPEYRKVRSSVKNFMQLCQTPELACEVTLQPLKRYALDAAILFSDILTIPDAMGLGVHFVEGEGPRLENPASSPDMINALKVPVIKDDLDYVLQAVTHIRASLPTGMPLIGFSGSPWTLACYAVEGRGGQFKQALRLMYEQPDAMHVLLDKLTDAVSDYLIAQVDAGVNALMIFDTWGSLLPVFHYQTFSLFYLSRIVSKVKQSKPNIPIILYAKGRGDQVIPIADMGCDAIGIDWSCSLQTARFLVGDKVALQGNLDPTVLLAGERAIKQEVKRVLHSFGEADTGHIFNLGHGITPDVPPEAVNHMIDAVLEFSRQYYP